LTAGAARIRCILNLRADCGAALSPQVFRPGGENLQVFLNTARSSKPSAMNDTRPARNLLITLGMVFLLLCARAATAQQEPEDQPSAAPEGVPQMAIPADRLNWHLAGLRDAIRYAEEQLEEARENNDKARINILTRGIERMNFVRRPQKMHLSLEDAVRLALQNSYRVEVESFNPAIERTRVVEAEAVFDALFFSNITKNIVDRPTGSQLLGSNLDLLSSEFGIRKLTPAGLQTSVAYTFERTKTNNQFQQINPEYFSDLVLELRQPFLRGFGLDYNLSALRVAKNNKRISNLAFAREVQDTIRDVEERYWDLVFARRNVVITARLLAEFEQIYEYLDARKDFDIMPVQIAATRANLETSKADFVRVCANLADAEDALIALMNTDEINLADDIEIVPDDFPAIDRIEVDRLAEVQTALDNRREIKEQELRIDNAKIAVGRAKIDELPRLDVVFQYQIDGLGGTWDQSFDEMSRHNFVEYFIGVQFEWPIGNRGARAAHRRAGLQRVQAVAGLKNILEGIILEVNLAVRALNTAYEQIEPSFESAQAREREVESIVARAERKDINTLNSELAARQSLANSRRVMLRSILDHYLAITNLERAKGTLLRYNKIYLAEDEE
jgi:outer membrane protein